jgi:hypothetical protein
MVKKLEEQRKYDFEVLQNYYRRLIEDDQNKMDKILDEKQELYKFQDDET